MCILLISLANSFSFFGLIFVLRRTAWAVLSGCKAVASGGTNTEPRVAGAGVCMRGLMPADCASAAWDLLENEVKPCSHREP